MAEFCLSCWNKLNGTKDPPEKYIFSKELDLCEGCGNLTHVIVAVRRQGFPRFRFWDFPFLPRPSRPLKRAGQEKKRRPG